MAVGYWDFIF